MALGLWGCHATEAPDGSGPQNATRPGPIEEEVRVNAKVQTQPPTPATREALIADHVRHRYNPGAIAQLQVHPGPADAPWPVTGVDRERYDHHDDNPVRLTEEHPVSTFSIDVDTASYSNVRRLLNRATLPRQDAVRTEELINYFSYPYPVPETTDEPFRVYTEAGPSPWHADRQLLHIGIKGYELDRADLPPANLVFLVDVSGSMQSPDKLDLLKASLKLLSRQLSAEDRISICRGDRHGRIDVYHIQRSG